MKTFLYADSSDFYFSADQQLQKYTASYLCTVYLHKKEVSLQEASAA